MIKCLFTELRLGQKGKYLALGLGARTKYAMTSGYLINYLLVCQKTCVLTPQTNKQTKKKNKLNVAGAKVGPDQLGLLTLDRVENGFVNQTYLMFAPIFRLGLG